MPRDAFFTGVLLLVLAVVLASVLVTGANKMGPQFATSPQKTAELQVRHFGAAIYSYYIANHSLPPSLTTLTQPSAKSPAPFIDEIRNDPWGNPFEYRLEGKTFRIRSYGEDGRPDTDDDIVWAPEVPRWR